MPRHRLSSYGRRDFFCGGPCDMKLVTRQFERSWPSAETPSSIHWRRFYFQLTRVHSALKPFGRCALQIYLLTDLLIYLIWVHSTKGCSREGTQGMAFPTVFWERDVLSMLTILWLCFTAKNFLSSFRGPQLLF